MRGSSRTATSGRRIWCLGPATCVLLATAAGWWVAAGGAGAVSQPDRDEVADIYRRDCAVCHGADGQGSSRGPDLAGSGLALIDYTIRTGRMPIDEPDDDVRRSEPEYDPATIDALVAYVGELQDGAVAEGPGLPEIDLAAGDVATGGQVWRQECAACHAWSGTGGALLHRSAPDVRQATPREVAASVRSGPFEMPQFGEAAITQEELDSLVVFVEEELRAPEDPGGWPIGHFGPVAEGGIALVGGVGVLAVVTRLLGTGRERR